MTKLSLKASNPIAIRKIKHSDLLETLKVCFKSFKEILPGMTEDYMAELILEPLHGNLGDSYIAIQGDQIIGGYFISRQGLPDEIAEEHGVENLIGVEGVALFLLPEFRGSGIGKQLREIPKSLGVDYIWGQHFKELNNLENWTNYGRQVVFEDDEVFITMMRFR